MQSLSVPPIVDSALVRHKNAELYHQDFYAWINSQVALLRQGRIQDLNPEFLAEELEDVGNQQRKEIVSRLIVLIAHLLKWQYQPKRRSSSWRGSIIEQRMQVHRELRFSPSLKPFLPEAIDIAYPEALYRASKETKLDKSVFPKQCLYVERELLDEDYWPE